MDDNAIRALWDFWSVHRTQIERAIAERTLLDWTERISERVSAIDEPLDWEFGRGLTAKRYFCVYAKGDSEVQAIRVATDAHHPPDAAVPPMRGPPRRHRGVGSRRPVMRRAGRRPPWRGRSDGGDQYSVCTIRRRFRISESGPSVV